MPLWAGIHLFPPLAQGRRSAPFRERGPLLCLALQGKSKQAGPLWLLRLSAMLLAEPALLIPFGDGEAYTNRLFIWCYYVFHPLSPAKQPLSPKRRFAGTRSGAAKPSIPISFCSARKGLRKWGRFFSLRKRGDAKQAFTLKMKGQKLLFFLVCQGYIKKAPQKRQKGTFALPCFLCLALQGLLRWQRCKAKVKGQGFENFVYIL